MIIQCNCSSGERALITEYICRAVCAFPYQLVDPLILCLYFTLPLVAGLERGRSCTLTKLMVRQLMSENPTQGSA